jgi:A/G-specific adenine glycosylase
MLQQTQAAAVVPYFRHFVKVFPSVVALARARENDVLRLWEGLGYYRRARALHAAARIMVERHGGKVPSDPLALAALPGVGRYIQGAILSQAFAERWPVVEANSERVLCRLLGLRQNPKATAVQRWLWQTAEALLPSRGAGDHNQALMELGALVCMPRAPRCQSCPLISHCRARRSGLEAAIPRPKAKPSILHVREVAVALQKRRNFLLVQRPNGARWAGLWEFPRFELADGDQPARVARTMLEQRTGLRATIGTELLSLCHTVTRHRIRLVCLRARYQAGQFQARWYPKGRWVRTDELSAFAGSVTQRRLTEALREESSSQAQRAAWK